MLPSCGETLIPANLVTAAALGILNGDTRAEWKTKKPRDVAAEILQGNVACCSRNADCQQCIHHPKASSLLLLQTFQQPKQSLSPNMFRQVVQLWEALFSFWLIAREFQNQTHLFSEGSSISSSVLVSLLQAGIPSPCSCPAESSQLCPNGNAPSPPGHQQLHLRGERGLSTLERLFGFWDNVNWMQNGNPKISLGKKAPSYQSSWWKGFQGLCLPASPYERAWHSSAKWETNKFSIIWKIKISSCSLPHYKRQ